MNIARSAGEGLLCDMIKPGEMVKCNIFDGYPFLIGEEIYHVDAVKNVSFRNQMLRLTGDEQWFYSSRFEQWPSPLDREPLPFKEGDKIVGITDCAWYFKKGDVFILAEMRPGILRFKGRDDWFTWELFEKADETDQTKGEAKTMEPCEMNAVMPARPKAMISQPMAGRKKGDILNDREGAEKYLRDLGYDVVNTVFDIKDYNPKALVYSLSMSIQEMSRCEVVYFMKGWQKARGCKIEHDIAKSYGMRVMYEGETEQEQKFRELREAAAPLVEYMNQNYWPHNMAIVKQDGVEIISGQMSISFPVRD